MEDMQLNDACKVADWFVDESTVWIPPAKPVIGRTRIHALFRALFSRYNYVRWEIIDILPVSENRCIHICDSIGDMKGVDNYSNRVITDITFNEQGKIIMLSDYFKDTSVFLKASRPSPVQAPIA